MDRPMDFKKIIHLRPSMQSVNVNCIVLDKRPPLESKRVPVTLFLVADESASIVVSIIGEAGHKIQPGDMLTIRDCKMILTYGSMRIRVDKEEKLKRWGEDEMIFLERPFMSHIKFNETGPGEWAPGDEVFKTDWSAEIDAPNPSGSSVHEQRYR